MKLIPDWRRAWRFNSVRAAVLLAALSVLQAQVLPLWQFALPADVWPWVSAGVGTLIVLLRVLAQDLPQDLPPTPPQDQPSEPPQ